MHICDLLLRVLSLVCIVLHIGSIVYISSIIVDRYLGRNSVRLETNSSVLGIQGVACSPSIPISLVHSAWSTFDQSTLLPQHCTMSRSPSTSSNERSSSSADRTASTSQTSPDLGYSGKGRELYSPDLDEDEVYGMQSYSWDRRTSWAGRLQMPSTPAFISKRIIHPYPLSSGPGRRRRSSLFTSRFGGQRRVIQLVLALSIPLFGLLLANELRIGADRLKLYANVTTASRTHDWEGLDTHTPPCEITELKHKLGHFWRDWVQDGGIGWIRH
jgi:hypothetical protein